MTVQRKSKISMDKNGWEMPFGVLMKFNMKVKYAANILNGISHSYNTLEMQMFLARIIALRLRVPIVRAQDDK